MMSYEKAVRELPFLKFMLTGSIVIAGIEIQTGQGRQELSPAPTCVLSSGRRADQSGIPIDGAI
jgi:hypothetical protein